MSSSPRILLVDDLAMLRELGGLFLARSGRVELAASAAEAFEIATRTPPDIVIADMHLPDLSGTELCRLFKTGVQIGAQKANPPGDRTGGDRAVPLVLLLARPDSREDHAAAVRAGADEVLFKPLERDALVSSVRRLTDFATPRGLPRARIEQPVEITARGTRVEGRLVNVSRGGIFVAVPAEFSKREEVAVSFSLDGDASIVSPTAQVVWSDSAKDGEACVGLRFLEIDPSTISKLEHYVSDHFPRNTSVPL